MIRIPDLRWVVRFAWAFAVPAWFVWLAYEDRDLSTLMGLSAVICVAFALTGVARWRGRRLTDRRRWLLESMGFGLLTGALVAPVAVILMLVKISLHSHGMPDFSSADIGAVVNRTPIWAMAGVLSGEALGLIGAILGHTE
jgi:hypothetical protein